MADNVPTGSGGVANANANLVAAASGPKANSGNSGPAGAIVNSRSS
jgi:hypothetical protein